MWGYFNERVNNCRTSNHYYNKLCNYVDYDGDYKGGPENILMPSFDSAGLAREFSKVENDLQTESSGCRLTERMKWVQDQLNKRELKFHDTTGKGFGKNSVATVVPFITDFSKPVICYIATTNQFEKKDRGDADKPSGVVMGLALAEQLKRTDKYRNVIIVFINGYDYLQSSGLVLEMTEKRYFRAPVGDFVTIDNFFGEYAVTTSRYADMVEKTMDSLLENAGFETWDNEFYENSIRRELEENEYSVMEFGSCISWEAFESSGKDDSREMVNAEAQIKFCSTQTFKALYRILWQHALSMSANYHTHGLDSSFKH